MKDIGQRKGHTNLKREREKEAKMETEKAKERRRLVGKHGK